MSEQKIQLTSEQIEAIKIGKNITLSANAGSGKTKVLIDRYMKHIANSGASIIKRIVAITFTEKAAKEMLERLHKKVLEDYPLDAKLQRYLLNAKIMTIHSFCLNILQDYPLETELLPNFRLLEEVEIYRLKQRSKSDVFEEILDYGADIGVDLDLIFSYYQVDELNDIIDLILNSKDIYEQIKEIYDNDVEKYCEIIYEEFYKSSKDDVEVFLKELKKPKEFIQALKFNDANNKEYAINLYDKIIHNNVLEKVEERVDYVDYLFLLNDLVNFCKIKLNSRYLLVNMFDEIHNIKSTDYRKNFVAQYESVANMNNIAFQYNIVKQILLLVEKIKTEIEYHKQKLNGIDFDDMLHLTKKLLNDVEIARSIASQYDEIMIDEFQDTNNTQYAIIKSLAPLNNATDKPNLFIVGDEKQSIYRFRYADVEVFKNAQKDIAKSNTGNDIIKKESGNLQLTTTFRNMPVITGFINYVCNSAFAKIEAISNMSYNDLICGDKSKLENILPIIDNQALDDKYGSIKFLLSVGNETQQDINDDDNETESSTEAELVASYIKHIVNTTNYQYQDIGVLFRSRSKINKLFDALLEEKIPFTNSSGTGFFNRPEIYSLISYLKVLLNLQDEASLLGVMLSHFFYTLAPSDILEIKAESGDSLWNKLSTYCEKEYASTNIKEMYEKIKELSELSTNITITHLLRIILNHSNWIYAINRTPDAKQKQIAENIEKFITIAREFQNKGYYNLSDFIIYIQIKADVANKEPEANIIKNNTVKLLTIHAAKGLEFPIVVLYDLNSKEQNIKLPLIDKKYGLAINIPTSENNFTKQSNTLVNYIIKNTERQKREAERLRQIYVAMTRASEHLILSVSLKEKEKGYVNNQNSFFRIIANTIGLCDDAIKNIIDKNISNKQILNATIKILDEPFVNAKLSYEVITSTNLEANTFTYIDGKNKKNKIIEKTHQDIVKEPLMYTSNTIIGIETNRIFSASTLKITDEEKKYYHPKIRTNIIDSIEKGSGFHYLMEHFNDWYDNQINEEKLKKIIIKFLSSPNYLQFNTVNNIDMFLKLCNNVVNTKFIQRYKRAFKEAKFEYEFLIPNKHNFIGGVIDCIIKDENGNWCVIDWKTNQNPNFDKLKKDYGLQIKIYIYILMNLYEQSEYKAYLCFTEAAKINADDNEWIISFCYKLADKNVLYNEILELTENQCRKIIT